MAKMIKKGVIGEYTGKVGQVLIKRWKGRYVISTPPILTKAPSQRQLTQRQRFKQAAEYSKQVLQEDSPRRYHYERLARQRGNFPANIAISDYLCPPRFEEVDLNAYEGQTGDPILVKAHDKVKVQKVEVRIEDSEGRQLEAGSAERKDALRWCYTTNHTLAEPLDVTVVVRVSDMAGNIVEQRLRKAPGQLVEPIANMI